MAFSLELSAQYNIGLARSLITVAQGKENTMVAQANIRLSSKEDAHSICRSCGRHNRSLYQNQDELYFKKNYRQYR